MWLKMDLEGIEFRFRITGYKKSTEDKCYDEWCKVDLSLHANNWLDYRIISEEIMIAVEVETVRDCIGELLNDRRKESLEYECIEPDLEFLFHPKGVVDVDMELVVSFWGNGVVSANRMLLTFDRPDLEKLECYLKYITGLIRRDDAMVQKMMANGEMYE